MRDSDVELRAAQRAARVSAGTESKTRQPWRENIEAMTVAIIMAVMFKYFALEAYQIPTGSMQPTLMGQNFDPEPENTPKVWYVKLLDQVFGSGGSIKDRILVDKLSFHFRDPERFEVVIFKYPLNRAQNFVKRLVGMPGEGLRIENGDLWTRKDGSEPWQHLRRPERVLATQLRSLDRRAPRDGVYWTVEPSSAGASDGRDCRVDGAATLRFVGHGRGPILDTYFHGYPAPMQDVLPRHGKSDRNEVGDLRVAGSVRARADFQALVVELRESGRTYAFEIPGHAAPANARPRVSSEARDGAPSPISEQVAQPYKLPPDASIDFRAQNIDDVLTLALDGEVIAELEVPACDGQKHESSVSLRVLGGGAELYGLRVWRDIHYTPSDAGDREWLLGKDDYFMLGDNTQDSSDSREWESFDLAWQGMPAGAEFVRGNKRGYRGGAPNNPPDTNPVDKRSGNSVLTFFRDLYGELWIFDPKREKQLPGGRGAVDYAPFVPRNLITGRAVAVFWPLSIKYGAYRWKWVR